jgi:hypothetical protein
VTAADCQAVKDAHGLTMPVLYDPLNQINAAPFNLPVNHYHVVINEGMEITYKGKGDSVVSTEVSDALND